MPTDAARPLASLARGASAPEIGHDAPLDPSGRLSPATERRAINPRWLVGTVLVAVGGGGLIGAAIYGALDRETVFAEPAIRVAPQDVGVSAAGAARARKGDRLVVAADIAASRQAFKAPTTIRVGDKEIIRTRAFVRVAANLTLRQPELAADVPPFNPLRLIADDANIERQADLNLSGAEAEADVALVRGRMVEADGSGPDMSDSDALGQAEAARAAYAQGLKRAVAPLPDLLVRRALASPALALGYAPAPETPFSSIEVRMAPENVTAFPKTTTESTLSPFEERVVAVRRGETFEQALKANGATAENVRQIVEALAGRSREVAVAEGQRIRFLYQRQSAQDGTPALETRPGRKADAKSDAKGAPGELLRVMVYSEETIVAIAAIDDRGRFVSVAPPPQQASEPAREEDDEEEEGGSGPTLYQSLYETALKNEVPRAAIEELVRVFAYDVDFQRRAQGGDSFETLLSREDGEDAERSEILYAALTVAGEARRFYRFQVGEDGTIDYFDENGRSAKKFLLRKPISEGTFRSGFGYRRHPILRYVKMHTGVDWSDRVGTPVFSSGNGTVIKAEWDSGYGRRVEVQHANGYVTTYSHLSGFARGVQPGARVRQGQVIGFLGNSGLSTGPHLHYEVIVNGHYVDPLRIRLPRGRELDGRQLAEFRRERERIDALRARASNPTRIAQGEERR